MGAVNDILGCAKSRLIARVAGASEANVHIVAKPTPPDFGPHDVLYQLSVGAFNYIAQKVFAGRLRCTVWVKHTKDRAGAEGAAITNTTDGLLFLSEGVRNILNGSYLDGKLLAPLTADVAFSAVESDEGVVTCWQEFTFEVLTAMPTTATDNLDAGPDIGEPEA